MNKQQALERLAAIEKEAAELRKIIDAPDKKSGIEQAREWLVNFMNENAKKWNVHVGDGRQVWHLGDQWIFDWDFKNKTLWCYYYKVWEVFYNEYSMTYGEIQNLMKDVVLKPFYCEGFTAGVSAVPPAGRC